VSRSSISVSSRFIRFHTTTTRPSKSPTPSRYPSVPPLQAHEEGNVRLSERITGLPVPSLPARCRISSSKPRCSLARWLAHCLLGSLRERSYVSPLNSAILSTTVELRQGLEHARASLVDRCCPEALEHPSKPPASLSHHSHTRFGEIAAHRPR